MVSEGWQELTWELPLESPPEVVGIGRNAHGFVPSDRYRLPDLWSLHFYSYSARLLLNGRELPIRPGYAGLTPPNTTMETHYMGISVHIYVHFRVGKGATRTVRAMQDLGEEGKPLYDRLYRSIAYFTRNPARTQSRVWDILWDIASRSDAHSPSMDLHPAVRHTSDLIERRLGEPLSVSELAEEVGVSASYLARLFSESYDESVVGYIRRRRVERAAHLLRQSTLPIKAIAASVGMPDLQHFNKAVRAELGVSPRALRNGP